MLFSFHELGFLLRGCFINFVCEISCGAGCTPDDSKLLSQMLRCAPARVEVRFHLDELGLRRLHVLTLPGRLRFKKCDFQNCPVSRFEF